MDYIKAKKLLEKYGQQHLLRYYDELSDGERAELLSAISEIDFSILNCAAADGKKGAGKLSPADAMPLEETAERFKEFYDAGINAIKRGKVAAVLLAGGQGTRLGIDAPKGTFNIGIERELSIFACQMANLLQVAESAGEYPYLFVMTSTVNDGRTREFFKQNGYFGYRSDRIHFYVQRTAPAVSSEGKILLEEKYKPVLTPNGNGGWYTSLKNSPCGKILERAGIEWLNVYGVDNVLQKICDPVFIGATLLSGLPCSGKVVRKVSPEERVGVLCKENGLPAIVEYYELGEEYKSLRDNSGELVYCYGVILNYLFNVAQLDKISQKPLPYHFAEKKVSYIEDGVKVTPESPNAYKLETLTVDLIKLMGGCLGFEVERRKEFAPVKNMTGTDSVDTARALLIENGVKL